MQVRRKKRHHFKPGHGSSLSQNPIRSEINVTPLVDVVLVLLIIFMVVTPMLSRGVDVELPETINHEKKQDSGEQIVVSVASDGRVYVGEKVASEGDMVSLMHKALSGKSHEVHVKADRRLEYGKVRTVLERLHEAGAAQVALGTNEKKDGK